MARIKFSIKSKLEFWLVKREFSHLNFLPLFCLLDNGVFSLQLSVQADIAPVAQVLVYTTVPSGEVIADSAKFNTELCFNNKVSVHFLRQQPPDCSVFKFAHLDLAWLS